MRRLPLLLPLMVLLAGCDKGGDDFVAVGSTAPDIHVETLVAPATTSSLLKKRGKVVILDFWATWCGPCRAFTPVVESIYDRYRAQGVEAMAITNEDRATVAVFEQKIPHRMPVYLDPNDTAHVAFGAFSLPTVLVVDRQGHIAYSTSGFDDGTAATLEAAVTKALGKA